MKKYGKSGVVVVIAPSMLAGHSWLTTVVGFTSKKDFVQPEEIILEG